MLAACGQTQAAISPKLADHLQAILDDTLAAVGAPGVAVTVVLPGQPAWHGATGLAKRDPDTALVPSDRFRVGSVTKTFNAAVCLQLVEEGKLDLDAAFDDVVTGYNLGPDVTIARLLSHIAGIYNYTDDSAFLFQGPATPETVIRFALDHGAVGAPGELWNYANTGYFLTGLVIEAVEGRPFHEAVRQRLLDPMGLSETYLEGPESLPGGIVDGHVLGANMALASPDFDMSWAWAAGGMVSTGDNLCRWAQALIAPETEDDAILIPASRTSMQAPAELNDGARVGYGLGLDMTERGGRDVIGHTGSTMGFKGEVFVDRQTGACVAISTNDFLSQPGELSGPLWTRLAEELAHTTMPH